jgi:signal transduction histidine kinase
MFSEQPSAMRPMRAGLARMVAVLRGIVAAGAGVSAVVGAVRPVSWIWLAPALALVFAWTPVYVTVAWTRGLRPWLVGTDLCIGAALSLAVGHLVPPAELPQPSSWVANIASMTVVSAQLSGNLVVSFPAGLLVMTSLVAGGRLGHSADGGIETLAIQAVQIVAAAAVMVGAVRIEQTAVGAFQRLQEARASAALDLARHEDERAQLRLVHNGPLTTLTMALHGSAGAPSATLTKRAAAAIEALPRLAAAAAADVEDIDVRLDERLSQVVVWYEPPLRIAAVLHPCLVPPAVAEAFTGAVSEALENVVRYAGMDRAAVTLAEEDGAVRVGVSDAGRGFDPGGPSQSGYGFGVREDLTGRMAAVRGTAVVRSSPGEGTAVDLEWRRG